MTIKQTLIDLEKSLLTFEVRHSEEELRQLLAPEFREIGASGAYFGLTEVLESLPSEESWSADVKDFECIKLSEDIYQLVFKAFIKSHTSYSGTYSLRSSIWKKFDNDWKMIFHQGTKTAPF